MSEPPAEPLADVTDWLYTQPRWLRSAAADVLAGARMSDDKIIEYAQFAIAEAAGTLAEPGISIGLGSLAENSGGAVSLVSIADVTGIGQLKPRNALSFGEEKLVVVFGPNGSGKSSYVRILKHACGARQKGDIHPNVFNALAEPARSSITFRTVDGQKTVEWGPSTDSIPQLSTVDIFDTSCGHSYLATEGKPTYEPQVLVFLSELATLSTQVATELGRQIAAHLTTLPSLPPDYLGTRGGKWYESLKPQTDEKDIEDNCGWSTADAEVLAELTKTLVERSPQDRAKEFETKATFVSSLIENVTRDCNAFSDDSCRALMSLRRVAREKQQIAEAAAEGNLRAAVLSGVGTEQWLALWEIARRYSSEVAYPEFAFPNVSTNARCLLCHQELTTEASHRLKAFDEYVADEAAAAARAAKAACAQAFLRLDSLPSDEMLEAKIASAGLDEHASRSLAGFYTLLRARRQQLISDVAMEHLGELLTCPCLGSA